MKHTLKEWVNFTGCYAAVDIDRTLRLFITKPRCGNNGSWTGDDSVLVDPDFHTYKGDWRESLTAPSEPPFKEGELIVSIALGLDCLSYWHSPACNKELWRRPTEEEWILLKGE